LSAQRKGKKVVGGTRRSTTPENIVDVLSQIADEVNWTPNERKKEKYFQCIVLLYSLTENLLKWLIFVKVLWDRSASLSLAKEAEVKMIEEFARDLSFYSALRSAYAVRLIDFQLFRGIDRRHG